jgi:lysozyme
MVAQAVEGDAMNRDALAAQLAIDEGVRLKPYQDTVGKLTIGVGRNLDDVGISKPEAMMLLGADIDNACADLDRALPWWRNMSDRRMQALANMCFNMGIGDSKRGLLSFRNTLTKMQAGDYAGAAQGMLESQWARQVGERAQRLAQMMREG